MTAIHSPRPWSLKQNAQLIAAAPDLLTALENILAYEEYQPHVADSQFPEGSYGREIYSEAQTAINKAKGIEK